MSVYDVQAALSLESDADHYAVVFKKDGGPCLTGTVTSPTLTVTRAIDEEVLVDGQTLTEIGSTGVFSYATDEDNDDVRATPGDMLALVISATIDAGARTVLAVLVAVYAGAGYQPVVVDPRPQCT